MRTGAWLSFLGRTWVLLVAGALLAAAPTPVARLGHSLGAAQTRATILGTRCMSTWSSGAFLAWAGEAAQQSRHALSDRLLAAAPAAPRATAWQALASGVRYRSVENVRPGLRLYQVSMDPRRARLKVLYARDVGLVHASVPELAQRANALSAINASYFDGDNRPLGYLKIDGRVKVPDVATGGAFTGVFLMRGRTARIVARSDFDPREADTAIQAGPRLVAGGVPTSGLLERRSFRQSGIAVTRDGQIVIYATDGSYSGMTWEQTRRILLGPADAGGVDPRDVLNLDGGSSSQIYIHAPGTALSTGFPTPVPVVVAFLRR